MITPWDRFKQAARLEEPDQVPVGLIVDSSCLTGIDDNTLDYFLYPERWLDINLGLRERFPDAVWVPGFWVEYGMAAEPSAFGARTLFHQDRSPSIMPTVEGVKHWADAPLPDVHEAGFMPFVLRLQGQMDARLRADGLAGIKMVAARGPVVTAGWIMGMTNLMTAMIKQPDALNRFLDKITTTLIRWLHAQLDTVHDPEGIILLDDMVGMVSVKHYKTMIAPHLRRIFDEFEGLVRIYHNDTPCAHLYPALGEANFDVFNFSYVADIAETKAVMGHRVALMGNVAPLDPGVRGTPGQVEQAAIECLDKAAPGGGLILSMGGGVSQGMPPENIDAMLRAAREWHPPSEKP